MSLTSVDFPEPLTPVTAVSTPSGMRTSMFLRLFARAPLMTISPERRPPPEPMIYFPFGAGPRSCIGNHFAMQELMIMTILFLRRFRFRLQEGFAVEPDPLITLRPRFGMRMHLSRRVG